MDDMWSPEPLNRIRRFFPENHNGSRIVITTRVSNVVAPSSSSIQMNLLDENKSWDLFCKTVFPEGVYPLEFEELGKNIARNCKGLPLSIVVIGGFLSKLEQTAQHWEYVARNLSSIVNLEDDERCLKILYLSYRQMPIHLKPCFLYLGLFPEDEQIRVSYLVKLLVAEGFLKPIDGKPLEAVAEIYIRDLVDRNLLLVDQWGSVGSIKSCKIHDLLRDLCLKEAQKENFMCLVEENNLHTQGDMNTQRRIAVRRILLYKEYPVRANEKLQSASLARSLTWEFQESLPSFKCKLLWTLNASHTYLNEANSNCESIFQLYNLRFVGFGLSSHYQATMLSSMSHVWNLQTLIIGASYTPIYGAVEIWKMPQLRHVKVHWLEFAPPNHNCILNNLQTLCKVSEFECSREVVERLPNIQKLAINVGLELRYGLKNLEHLHKLEHLQCEIWPMRICKFDLQQNISLPRSLKKLSLWSTVLRWEDVTPMVGSLPCLEKLTLRWTSGSEWRPTTGQFLSLKFLGVYGCVGLEHWIADSSHFPLLEHLILKGLRKLAEIPLDIGEIPTLQLIEVEHCGDSVVISAKAIAKEHDEIGDSQLQIHVSARKDSQLESLASLASQNFQVKIDEVKNA